MTAFKVISFIHELNRSKASATITGLQDEILETAFVQAENQIATERFLSARDSFLGLAARRPQLMADTSGVVRELTHIRNVDMAGEALLYLGEHGNFEGFIPANTPAQVVTMLPDATKQQIVVLFNINGVKEIFGEVVTNHDFGKLVAQFIEGRFKTAGHEARGEKILSGIAGLKIHEGTYAIEHSFFEKESFQNSIWTPESATLAVIAMASAHQVFSWSGIGERPLAPSLVHFLKNPVYALFNAAQQKAFIALIELVAMADTGGNSSIKAGRPIGLVSEIIEHYEISARALSAILQYPLDSEARSKLLDMDLPHLIAHFEMLQTDPGHSLDAEISEQELQDALNRNFMLRARQTLSSNTPTGSPWRQQDYFDTQFTTLLDNNLDDLYAYLPVENKPSSATDEDKKQQIIGFFARFLATTSELHYWRNFFQTMMLEKTPEETFTPFPTDADGKKIIDDTMMSSPRGFDLNGMKILMDMIAVVNERWSVEELLNPALRGAPHIVATGNVNAQYRDESIIVFYNTLITMRPEERKEWYSQHIKAPSLYTDGKSWSVYIPLRDDRP